MLPFFTPPLAPTAEVDVEDELVSSIPLLSSLAKT